MLVLNEYDTLTIAQTEKMAQELQGFFVWKDKRSRYLGGNENAGPFLNLPKTQALIGASDFDIDWLEGGHTAEYFQAIDKQVISGLLYTNEKEMFLHKDEQNKIRTTIVVASKRPLLQNGACIGMVLQATDITHLMFPSLSSKSPTLILNDSEIKFTTREIDCMKLLVHGYSYKRIATMLNLSKRTVEHYSENIRDKLNCHNKQALIDKLLCLML